MTKLSSVLILIIMVSHGVTSQTPLIERPGTTKVLVLFDLHRELRENGECVTLNSQSVEMLHSVVWAFDRLVRTAQFSRDVGLAVYDTCGSADQARSFLVDGTKSCSGLPSSKLGAIISYVSDDVRRVIKDAVDLSGYLHVSLNSGSCSENSRQESDINISVTSHSVVQSLLAAIKPLNWRHISTLSMANSTAANEQDLFDEIARGNGICIRESIKLNSEMLTLPNLNSIGAIFFTSGIPDLQLTEILKSLNQSQNSVIIWNKKTITLPTNPDPSLHAAFSITDTLPDLGELGEYFHLLLKSKSLDSTSMEYFTINGFCSKDNYTNQLINCSSQVNNQVASILSNWHVLASLSAILVVEDAFHWFDQSQCQADMTFVACKSSQAPDSDVIQGYFGRLGLKNGYNATVAVSFGELQEPSRKHVVTAFLSTDTAHPIGIIENNTFFLTNEAGWSEIERHVPQSLCDGYCPQCMEIYCLGKPKRTEPAIIVPGEIMIVGTFPIHSPSPSGMACGDVSMEGIMAVEAFLWAVDTFKERFSLQSSFPNTSIGALVFDTCSQSERHDQLVGEYKRCAFMSERFADESSRSAVLAHLRVTQQGHFGKEKQEYVIPRISLSKSGIDAATNFKGEQFITAIKNVLVVVNWKRVTIIYSRDTFDEQFHRNFARTMRDYNIEILYKLQYSLRSSEPVRARHRRFLLDLSNESPAVIVLSNAEDTALLLSELSTLKFPSNPLDFFFMPWHAEIVDSWKGNVTRGSLILKQDFAESSRFNKYWQDLTSRQNERNPWWKQYQDSRRNCNFYNYRIENSKACDDQSPVKATTSAHVVKITSIMLLTLGKVHEDLCGTVAGRCANMADTENVTRAFSDHVTTYSAELPSGTILQIGKNNEMLLPMNLFHVGLLANIQIKIGSIGPDGKLSSYNSHLVQSYLSNKNRRKSQKNPSWCPRCYQCSNATRVHGNYYYEPGDVILVGIFPLHTSGSDSFKCGRILPNGYVEAEAFKYATRTVKRRYDKLYSNPILSGIKVGALIIDSCSAVENIVSKILNFEACRHSYHSPNDPYVWPASPRTVIGYVAEGRDEVMEPVSLILRKLKRTLITPASPKNFRGTSHPYMLTTASTHERQSRAVISFLHHYNWTKVAVVCSKEYQDETNDFSNAAGMRNICLSDIYYLETLSYATVDSVISRIQANKRARVILTLLNDADSLELFDIVEKRKINRIWINIGSHNWINVARRVAKGTIFVERTEGYHHGFYDAYFSNRLKEESSPLPWKSEILAYRKWCTDVAVGKVYETNCLNIEVDHLRLRAKSNDMHRLIEAVDSLLHGFNQVYSTLCPDRKYICKAFADTAKNELSSMIYKSAKTTTFTSESQIVRFRDDGRAEDMGKYIFQTYEPKQEYRIGSPQFNKVAQWYDGKLSMTLKSKLVIYDLNGYPYKVIRSSSYTNDSLCINFEPSGMDETSTKVVKKIEIRESFTPAVFVPEIWVLVMVSAMALGVFVAILILLYVSAKLFIGTLNGCNVWFGMLLLVGIVLLYLSCIPFFFSPSKIVCGMRYLAPSVAYAFCFSIMLVKLTNLREYCSPRIEGVTQTSKLNNSIFTLLITGVQIALSVQWWVLKYPLVVIKPAGTCSCQFDVVEFVTSQVYNMFLLFLCAIYSPSVCKDRANLREGRLICAYSWLACAVWLGWIHAAIFAPREYAEPAITVGIVICASLLIVVIFLPKITRISRIHYDLRNPHRNLPDNPSTLSVNETVVGIDNNNGDQPSGVQYAAKKEMMAADGTKSSDKKCHKPLQRMNGESLDCYY